jgi:hypothetical protein
MSDELAITPRVEAWRAAWQSGDAARVAALYAVSATHDSAKVAVAMPGLGRSFLKGQAEIEAYALRAFGRVHPLRFDITRLLETDLTSTVEYIRHAPNAEPTRVCEVLEWRHGKLVAVRVYHF